jgi:4-carboxymuconolactone decarboxylase
MDDDDSRFQRGVDLIEQIGGSTDAIFGPVADIAPDLGRYVAEFAFGDLYSRPGLDPPQRQLLTLAALIALGDCGPQLRFHTRAALNVGVAPAAIVETVLHCLTFTGFPRTVNAMAEVRAVFAERGLLVEAEPEGSADGRRPGDPQPERDEP